MPPWKEKKKHALTLWPKDVKKAPKLVFFFFFFALIAFNATVTNL